MVAHTPLLNPGLKISLIVDAVGGTGFDGVDGVLRLGEVHSSVRVGACHLSCPAAVNPSLGALAVASSPVQVRFASWMRLVARTRAITGRNEQAFFTLRLRGAAYLHAQTISVEFRHHTSSC